MSQDTSRDSRVLHALIAYLKRKAITRDTMPQGDSFLNVQPWGLLDEAFKQIESQASTLTERHFLRLLGNNEEVVVPGTGVTEQWLPIEQMRWDYAEHRILLNGISHMAITAADVFLSYSGYITSVSGNYFYYLGIRSMTLKVEPMHWFLFNYQTNVTCKLEDPEIIKKLPPLVVPGGNLTTAQKNVLVGITAKQFKDFPPVPDLMHPLVSQLYRRLLNITIS